jgi:hypothetical protein
MQLVATRRVTQVYASTKNIADIFGYKDPWKKLKAFREYAEANPKKFYPHKPFIKNQGMDVLYDILCFAYFFENQDFLEAGARNIPTFEKELPRLKEVYA